MYATVLLLLHSAAAAMLPRHIYVWPLLFLLIQDTAAEPVLDGRQDVRLAQGAGALSTGSELRSTGSTPPHLIIILVDDLGWHNVGWHNPLQKSPNIDALARSGAILERHYTYRFCSPSRSALLSGRLPLHVNEDNPPSITSKGGIDLRMTLLPQKLKQAGYVTATYGKWHLGARQWPNIPANRGFDHHLGFLTGGEDHYTQRAYEAVTGGHKPVDLWHNETPAYGRNGTAYSCNLYGDEASRLIHAHDAAVPLFLYMAFQNTHAPYQCPQRYLDPAVDFEGRRLMQGMVTCVDEATGNLTTSLKAKGMWPSTLLLWSADNGGPQYWSANNYPLRGGKGTDFEGSHSGPCHCTREHSCSHCLVARACTLCVGHRYRL